MTYPISFEESSGNIFQDLGFDDETSALLTRKAEIVGVLHLAQQECGMNETAFGKLVGFPQARLSNLYGGRFGGMSPEKLLATVAKDHHPGGRASRGTHPRRTARTGTRMTLHPAPTDKGIVAVLNFLNFVPYRDAA